MEILFFLTAIGWRFGILQLPGHTVPTSSCSMTAASLLSPLTIDLFGRTEIIGIAFHNIYDIYIYFTLR
jgi:hypothetical protein